MSCRRRSASCGNSRHHPLVVGGDLAAVPQRDGAHLEILVDGQGREDPPALHDLCDAGADDPGRRGAGDVLAVEDDATLRHLAAVHAEQPGDRPQQGGLSRSVRTEHRHDLAVGHLEAHRSHDEHHVVVDDLHAVELEERGSSRSVAVGSAPAVREQTAFPLAVRRASTPVGTPRPGTVAAATRTVDRMSERLRLTPRAKRGMALCTSCVRGVDDRGHPGDDREILSITLLIGNRGVDLRKRRAQDGDIREARASRNREGSKGASPETVLGEGGARAEREERHRCPVTFG